MVVPPPLLPLILTMMWMMNALMMNVPMMTNHYFELTILYLLIFFEFPVLNEKMYSKAILSNPL